MSLPILAQPGWLLDVRWHGPRLTRGQATVTFAWPVPGQCHILIAVPRSGTLTSVESGARFLIMV